MSQGLREALHGKEGLVFLVIFGHFLHLLYNFLSSLSMIDFTLSFFS